jgi:hypothetical protein
MTSTMVETEEQPFAEDEYRAFLESKFKFSQAFGVEIEQSEINPLLQAAPARRSSGGRVKKGRAAIFARVRAGQERHATRDPAAASGNGMPADGS